jgi:hypothetical protein
MRSNNKDIKELSTRHSLCILVWLDINKTTVCSIKTLRYILLILEVQWGVREPNIWILKLQICFLNKFRSGNQMVRPFKFWSTYIFEQSLLLITSTEFEWPFKFRTGNQTARDYSDKVATMAIQSCFQVIRYANAHLNTRLVRYWNPHCTCLSKSGLCVHGNSKLRFNNVEFHPSCLLFCSAMQTGSGSLSITPTRG